VPTPEDDSAGRFGGASERQPGGNRGVWLWVIYRADIHVLGAIRRATRLHWNADGAKAEVCGVVNRLWSSRAPKLKRPIGTVQTKPPGSGGQRIMSVSCGAFDCPRDKRVTPSA